jgi:hypothetical protein
VEGHPVLDLGVVPDDDRGALVGPDRGAPPAEQLERHLGRFKVAA